MKHKREFRILPHAEIRVSRKGKKTGIEGYAAVFNQLSEDLGWFREMVMPGAFGENLKTDPDVRCLFNHDSNLVLGRTRAKTLTLGEDSKGLHFDCTPPDTQAARDLLTSIERGDVDQCSFGFIVRKQKWSEEKSGDGDSLLVRELHAVDLFDVSAVTFPVYPQTSVDTRKLWPDGAPRDVILIPRAFRQEEEDEAGECACQCLQCAAGDCEECDNQSCIDEACRANGCPNQDDDGEGEGEENSSGRIRIFPQAAGMGELRGAVAFKKTLTSDADSWDGDAARGRLAKWASSDGSGDKDKIDWSKYAQGFGWVDPDNKENFGGYKLPHHDVKDGKLVSVWGGVQGAMNALLGGRGGTNIPEGDRKAVYNHLASEYKLHGKDVPDFRAFLPDDAELRETFRRRVELASV